MNHWPTQYPLPWKSERAPWALKQHPSAHKSPPATSTAASKTNAVGHHCQSCFKGLTRNDCMSPPTLPQPLGISLFQSLCSVPSSLSPSLCSGAQTRNHSHSAKDTNSHHTLSHSLTHAHTQRHALNINISSALDSSEIYSAAKPAENWLVSWRQAIDTLPLGELGRQREGWMERERKRERVRVCMYEKAKERERERARGRRETLHYRIM